MDKKEFMEGIHLIQNAYNKKFTQEQLTYFYENLKDMSKINFILNIKEHIRTSKWLPTIADIRKNENRNYSNANFDSSYWYTNLKQICDESGRPYFDINTGEPLPPYKT